MGVFDRLQGSLNNSDKTIKPEQSASDAESASSTNNKVFADLEKKLSTGSKSEGVTPLDIADLPRLHRDIMFFMLRNQHAALEGVTLADLREKLTDPPEERLTAALADLFKNGWVIAMGEPPNFCYKINLRRKRGAQFNGVYSNIMDQLQQKQSDKPWHFKFD